MAVMGVRINDGGGVDTSVANVFAKALFGDPEREMKFARLESDLATDEYQRAQIKANEDYIRSQEALKEQQFQGNEAMVPALAKLFQDFQTSAQQPGPAATEAPVPVELGPDPYVPIPADRPTDQIISAFPARPGAVSDNAMPVPVGEPIVDQIVSGGFPGRPDVGAGAPVGPFPGRPQAQLDPILTESPAGVGPFPGRPGLPASSRTSDATVISSILRDLRQRDMEEGLRPAYDEPPAPVTDLSPSPEPGVPEDLSPYYPPEIGFTGDVPVPVDLETMTPPVAAAPAPQPGLRSIDGPLNVLPGNPPDASVSPDMPVPVEPMVASGAGEFVDPNAGREPRPEEVKAVADEVQRRTGTGLSFEDAQGIARGLIANGGDIAGNFNKLLGTAGLTYGDPSNGEKLRQSMALLGHAPNTTMIAGASDKLAQEHAIAVEGAKPEDLEKNTEVINGVMYTVGKDAAGNKTLTVMPGSPAAKPNTVNKGANETVIELKTDAAGTTTGVPVSGIPEAAPADPLAGSDNEQETIIRDVSLKARDPKAVITPEDATNYDLIYNKLSVPHIEMRQVEGKNGKETVGIEVPGRDLSMYPKPQDVARRAGIVLPAATAPAPVPVSPEVSAQQVAQPAADPAAAPPATAAQDTANVQAPSTQPIDPQNIVPTAGPPVGTQGDGSVLGTSGYKIIVPGPGRDRTEFQDRAWIWLQEAAAADQALKAHTAPPWYRQWAAARGSGSSADVGFFDAMIKHYGTDNATRQFMALASTFINSEGRINSGAAIQNYENVALGYRFIDQDGDDEETRALKADQRQIAMGGIYDALANNNLMTPQMAASLKAMGYDRNAPSRQSSPNIVDYDPNVHGGGNN
jgi:hypothetical protein